MAGKNEFSYAYRQRKNPGISLIEINDVIETYQKSLHRWKDILVEQVDEDLFCFYRN